VSIYSCIVSYLSVKLIYLCCLASLTTLLDEFCIYMKSLPSCISKNMYGPGQHTGLFPIIQKYPLCSNFCIKYGSHFTNDHVFCFGFHYYQVNLLKYFTISLIRYFSSSVKYLCDIREIFIRSMNVSLRLQYILATAFETIGNYMVNCSLINYLKYNNTSNEIHIYFVIVLSRSIS
jgi:hypothetical protein